MQENTKRQQIKADIDNVIKMFLALEMLLRILHKRILLGKCILMSCQKQQIT